MKDPELVLSYASLSDPKYGTKVGVIIEGTFHSGLFQNVPEQCSEEVVTKSYLSYKEAYQAGINGDRGWISERRARRAALDKLICALGHYIQMVAAGDFNLLLKSGFDVKGVRTGNGKSKQSVPTPATPA